MYKDNKYIIIPRVITSSKNILIMSYEYGISFGDLDYTDYKKRKILSLMHMFIKNNTIIENFIHGDIHKGNWKVSGNNLVIYDYGFCFSLDDKDINILHKLIHILDKPLKVDDKKEKIEELFRMILNSNDCFLNDIDTLHIDDLIITIRSIIKQARYKKIKLSTNLLLSFIILLQFYKYFKDNGLIKDEMNHDVYLDIYAICQTLKTFPKYEQYLRDFLFN